MKKFKIVLILENGKEVLQEKNGKPIMYTFDDLKAFENMCGKPHSSGVNIKTFKMVGEPELF